MHLLIADSGPQNIPWIPDSPSFPDHVRPFSPYSGLFLLPWKPQKQSGMVRTLRIGAVHGCECVLAHHSANVKFPKVRV